MEKFIWILIICTLMVIIMLLLPSKSEIIQNQFIVTLFYFTPAISVWIAEKKSIGKILREYKVNFKSIYIKQSLIYILGTAFVYPLINIFFIFFAGNILEIQSFGHISIPNEGADLFGIILPRSVALRFIIPYLCSVCFMLIAGLTYNAIYSLGGELGWRGFLGKNLNLSYYKRNIVTGLIWGTWFLPIVLYFYAGEPLLLLHTHPICNFYHIFFFIG